MLSIVDVLQAIAAILSGSDSEYHIVVIRKELPGVWLRTKVYRF